MTEPRWTIWSETNVSGDPEIPAEGIEVVPLADLQAAQEERDTAENRRAEAVRLGEQGLMSGWKARAEAAEARFESLADELERRADEHEKAQALAPKSVAGRHRQGRASAYRIAASLVRQAPHEQEVGGGG